MINNDKILLLNDIKVDTNLPKYKITKEVIINNSFNTFLDQPVSGVITNSIFTSNDDDGSPINIPDISRRNLLRSLEYKKELSGSLKDKLLYKLFKILYHKQNTKEIDADSIIKFFELMKQNVSVLDETNIRNVLNKYNSVLNNAIENNQIALSERIKAYSDVLRMELMLSASEFKKFLSEEDVVKFYHTITKNKKSYLRLTYLKNFIRVIPDEIIALKKKADELKVFDNYVILHYDKEGNSSSDTNEEIEKKKDPILFGVILGSRKLYYIGDWIDEYCNLTLGEIIDKLGKEKCDEITIEEMNNNISKI